jgi:hypothetical protein
MDELLAPPSKRTCCRQMNDTAAQKPSDLSGHLFVRLRRKLNWEYHIFKKKQIKMDLPIMSKEEWLREQDTKNVPNYADLEQGLKCDKSLSYSHQRIGVLSARKAKNVGLMEGLRKCIYSGQSFSKIREADVEEPSDVIDLTDDLPKFTLESTTKAQMNRVTVQCITVLQMMQQLDQKNDSEMSMLKRFQSDINIASSVVARDLICKQHDLDKKQF